MLRLKCAPILVIALTPALYAQCGPCAPNPPNPPTHPVVLPPDGWVWSYSDCAWEIVCNPDDPSCGSPIMIDTDGSGFHLTSAANGVKFDFYGTGQPFQIAWTEEGSTTGFLVLPTNGQVLSVRQNMFGNATAQYTVAGRPPNGFAALAVYDLPAFGGNNNGAIDPGDAVWRNLRVWIDANHDGISQPEELHTLGEIGIERILLRYELSSYTDEYGNEFRYRGHLIAVSGDKVDRKIFDVFLATE